MLMARACTQSTSATTGAAEPDEEEGRLDFPLHLQPFHLTAQPLELLALGARERLGRRLGGVDLGSLHPTKTRLKPDPVRRE
jgi:hypothetical protein